MRVCAILITVLLCGACRDVDEARNGDQTPIWLQTKIAQLEAEPVANPPARLYRFGYRQQSVYYLPPRCCDIQSELYDASGATLCYPDGGFTGNGDGRCSDFAATRTNCELIWSDPRAKAKGDGDCVSLMRRPTSSDY